MEYRIVVDSCGELTDEMKKSGIYKTASLSMEVDGVHIQDDESFDQADFLKRVAESSECPKSSCPSPEKYMELYHCEAERVYAVTLSAELSGSHNSAELGRKLYEEEYGRKQIHVFNSRSASVGESLIALKIQECEEKGMEFEERDIKIQNPTKEELKEWHEKSSLPLKRFFNTSGMLYKEQKLKERLPQMTEEEQYEVLASDGMLVKRPILVTQDTVLTGFKEKEWEELL